MCAREEVRKDSRLFAEMCAALVENGYQARFRAHGQSMQPNILEGDEVIVSPAVAGELAKGDVALIQNRDGLRLHRVACKEKESGNIITRSDTGRELDPVASRFYGKVSSVIGQRGTAATETKLAPWQTRFIHPTRIAFRRVGMAANLRLRRVVSALFGIATLLALSCAIAVPSAFAQADLTMTQTPSVTTTPITTNYTYTETVTNNGPNQVPANTLVVYQQTPPNTTFRAITATGWSCKNGSGGALASGYAGPIICTLTTALNSGASAPNNIVITERVTSAAAGTSIQNSATVTSQLADPVPSNNTTVTSILVEPTASSDLALSMSVAPTPVFISSTLTYTLQVQNLGPSGAAATSGLLSDTLPSGVTFVSYTAPAGWTCSDTAGTVSCNSAALAANSSATVTITVTAPANAATLTNTATVTLATDQNANNNTASVITVVQPIICATPGRDGAGGTLTGIVNTYFPPNGTGNFPASGTPNSIALGAASGANTPIAAGDLVLIIQMQDATINSTNTSSYGDGNPGDPATGSTSTGTSGMFEFVTATNAVPITGGTLQFTGSGTGNSTLNTYTETTGSGTQSQQTFQVIRVPQYTSATLGSGLVPLAWNGSVGGVLALDVAAQLTLGGTVALDAMGFRGGGGRLLAGNGTGANTDYVTLSSNPANASKGEGIAGTPEYLAPATFTTTTTATNTGVEGLPGGSYARGAPGNAGGGGTDGDASGNTENSGGGGGGNGGTGGLGGYGWNTFTALNSTDGGFGGAAFPATTSALLMGGGGGAGSTNNGSYYISATNHNSNTTTPACSTNPGATCTGIYSSGGAGGGIAIIHAGSVVGTGTISSNGQSTTSTDNDSTGGGGAGGSIEVYANSGGLGGLTISAVGGSAGDAWPESAPGAFSGNRHGPGGGGAGGVAILSGAATINLAGGINGYTDTAQDSYGATPGTAGVSSTAHIITETPGTQSGAYCAGADLSVTNSGLPAVVAPGGAITYTQVVKNNGPLDAVNAVFTEAVPANTTFASITSPAGWSCTTPAVGASGNITCTDPAVANAASGTFTVVVNVAAGTINGTQIVDVDSITSGTNDPNLANNSATALTTVGAATTADLTITNTASSPTTLAGNNVTMTAVVKNQGPAAALNAAFSETISTGSTFVSLVPPAGWTCSTPAVGGTGLVYCTTASVAIGASATFPLVLNVPTGTTSGTVINDTATVSAATSDPNPSNNSATATTIVATAGQADLAVTSSATPNPVSPGNNITYIQTLTNNGPATVTNGTVTSVTFTDTIPANTTLASAFTAPTGWTCNTIAVGGTGTFTCTLNAGQTIASGGSVNFPLVVKVNAGTASGTTITNTDSVNTPCSATLDPNCANNSASSSVVVATPTQSDVSITKIASPNPVNQGTNLTYTLNVTNGGPAIAQGVTVTDVLPAQVVWVSDSSTAGSCTYTSATTTVSCSLGNMSVGGSAVVTINATASTFSTASLSSNTATVSSTTTDPNLSNNSSTFVSTIQAPTAVDLASFRAYSQADGTSLLEWRTHEESRNLGFNIYREDESGRHPVNSSIIAGSGLLLRGSKPQHAAKFYQWIDRQPVANASYWIEDLDINGTRTMHGPFYAEPATAEQTTSIIPVQRAALLTEVQARVISSATNLVRPNATRPALPAYPANYPRFVVASHDAVKIAVSQEGWYHITLAQLYAAGLQPGNDTRNLHLYAEGIEQPLLITGRQVGPVSPNDAIEFYGTGIDTPFSGTRVYWLIRDNDQPKRIVSAPTATSGSEAPASFPFTVVREDHTTYFSALLNGENNDNFFGAIVTTQPVEQDLLVTQLDPAPTIPVTLEVVLQGVTDQQEHAVSVQLNGTTLGMMGFANQTLGSQSFPVEVSLLQNGTNSVTLTSLNGDNDISLVQSIQLQYAHKYAADGDWLRASIAAGSQVIVAGFTNPQIRIFDISDPLNISELSSTVSASGSGYSVTAVVPHGGITPRTILAFANDVLAAPDSLTKYIPNPTFLDDGRAGDYVVITHPTFAPNLAPLTQLRESQGHRVAVVTSDEIYDEYNYGEHSPFALRSFLQDAVRRWRTKPQSVLLVGDASMDPRNYLGFGDFDFVPTRIIETAAFKTSSDDWLTDFQETGFATIPTGRLPVRTTTDVDLVVSKIVNYEKGSFAGSWNGQALVVGDQNVDIDFTTAATAAASAMPGSLQVTTILANNLDFASARTELLTALNNGSLLVNYSGHGAEQQWSFSDLFDTDDAAALSNGGRLPVYLVMDCLNGFFQDVYAESLAKSLLMAPNGGAVAVWASSGFTNQPPQATMNLSLLSQINAQPNGPLGRMILSAKSGITDNDVRRTWILFGDPAMKLQFPPATPGSGAASSLGNPLLQAHFPKVFGRSCASGSGCSKERQNE